MTWPVTGATYRDTAEVAFIQHFNMGPDTDDVVRLMADDGQWRWFFGRSRDFIDEQIEAASPAIYPATTSDPPKWAVDALLAGQDGLESLPETYPGDSSDPSYEGATKETGSNPQGSRAIRYATRPDYYTVASVTLFDIVRGRTPPDTFSSGWTSWRGCPRSKSSPGTGSTRRRHLPPHGSTPARSIRIPSSPSWPATTRAGHCWSVRRTKRPYPRSARFWPYVDRGDFVRRRSQVR